MSATSPRRVLDVTGVERPGVRRVAREQIDLPVARERYDLRRRLLLDDDNAPVELEEVVDHACADRARAADDDVAAHVQPAHALQRVPARLRERRRQERREDGGYRDPRDHEGHCGELGAVATVTGRDVAVARRRHRRDHEIERRQRIDRERACEEERRRDDRHERGGDGDADDWVSVARAAHELQRVVARDARPATARGRCRPDVAERRELGVVGERLVARRVDVAVDRDDARAEHVLGLERRPASDTGTRGAADHEADERAVARKAEGIRARPAIAIPA